MSNERLILSRELCEAIIKELYSSLERINTKMKDTFLNGPDNNNDMSMEDFENIWGKCSIAPEEFDDISLFTKYYQTLHDTTDIPFYKNIIKIYYTYAKHIFIFSQLKQIPFLTQFFEDITLLKGLCDRPSFALIEDDAQKRKEKKYRLIKSYMNGLENIHYDLVESLAQHGYPREKLLYPSKPKTQNLEAFTLKTREYLNRLPKRATLDEQINALNKAILEHNKRDIKRATVEIEKSINELEICKKELEKCFQENLMTEEQMHFGWFEEGSMIDRTLELANRTSLFSIREWISLLIGNENGKIQGLDDIGLHTINSLGKTFVDQCNKQSGKWKFIGTSNTKWNEVGEFVNNELLMHKENVRQVVYAYSPYFKEIEKIKNEVDVFHAEKVTLMKQREELRENIKKVKTHFHNTVESINKTQTVLKSYLALPQSYVRSFLSNHWLLILSGSLFLGGVAVAVAILTCSNPVGFGFLVAGGILMGGALGAIAGMTKDSCCPPGKDQCNQEVSRKAQSDSSENKSSSSLGKGWSFFRTHHRKTESPDLVIASPRLH